MMPAADSSAEVPMVASPGVAAARWPNRVVPLVVLAVLFGLGAKVAAFKLSIVREVEFIGHADEAAYATLARSLVAGEGLQVNSVSWFFRPYPREIVRREDHWPPFMGFAIAPFFMTMGSDRVWVAKIAPILIGSILLPLATAFLALAYGGRATVALIAGLLMLVNPTAFTASLTTLSDTPLAMLLAAFCATLLAARESPWLHGLTGVFLALACFAKGSEILLLGVFPVAAVLLSGTRVLKSHWFASGLAAAVLLMAPLWWGQFRAYGHPLHSTQNYVGGFIGLADPQPPGTPWSLERVADGWETGAYTIYWDKPLPRASDRWTRPEFRERYRALRWRNREAFTRWALLGTTTSAEAWDDLGALGHFVRTRLEPTADNAAAPRHPLRPPSQWREPLVGVPDVAAVVGTVCLVAWRLGIRLRRRLRGAPAPDEPGPGDSSPDLLRPTIVLMLVLAVHWLFLVYFWQWLWMDRLAILFVPVLTVIGLTMLSRGLEFLARGLRIGRHLSARWPALTQLGPPALAGLVALLVAGLGPGWIDRRIEGIQAVAGHAYPWVDPETPGRRPTIRMGRYLKEHLPTAVVMTRYPCQMLWYASPQNRGVNLPLDDDPQRILAVARHYRVTHIVRDRVRAALEPYFDGRVPGFDRVLGSPQSGLQRESPLGSLYQIDWAKIPPSPPIADTSGGD